LVSVIPPLPKLVGTVVVQQYPWYSAAGSPVNISGRSGIIIVILTALRIKFVRSVRSRVPLPFATTSNPSGCDKSVTCVRSTVYAAFAGTDVISSATAAADEASAFLPPP
jgi:hypothetical protein